MPAQEETRPNKIASREREETLTADQEGIKTEAETPEDEDLISMKRSQLLAILTLLYGWSWLLVLGIAVIATMGIGIFIDIRYSIISLMIIFLVSPLFIAYLYFYHGLKPMTAINIVPHRLTVSNNGIGIDIPDKPYPDKKEENIKGSAGHAIFHPYSSFGKYISGNTGFILIFTDHNNGFLWVPYSTFLDDTESRDFLEAFQKAQRPSKPISNI